MFVRDVAANGDTVLFVGTKKQAAESVKEEALRAGVHFVNARWLGGMMTNFKTIKRSESLRLTQLAKKWLRTVHSICSRKKKLLR